MTVTDPTSTPLDTPALKDGRVRGHRRPRGRRRVPEGLAARDQHGSHVDDQPRRQRRLRHR